MKLLPLKKPIKLGYGGCCLERQSATISILYFEENYSLETPIMAAQALWCAATLCLIR